MGEQRLGRTPARGRGLCHRCLGDVDGVAPCAACTASGPVPDVLATSIGLTIPDGHEYALTTAPSLGRPFRRLSRRLERSTAPVRYQTLRSGGSIVVLPLPARWADVASGVLVGPVRLGRAGLSVRCAVVNVDLDWTPDLAARAERTLSRAVDEHYRDSFGGILTGWPAYSFTTYGIALADDARHPIDQAADNVRAVLAHLADHADPRRFAPVDWMRYERPWGLI